ncbi:hypothetical protein [Streptomyces galilaeus]|uniref:hypothetical protein n=1 Tax=Streptomyces galilaeus TaxID=33899 RepID=UPI0038F6E90D
MEHMRAWSTRRKILVYLIAQLALLGLIVGIVRFWDIDVLSLTYLIPWGATSAGGLIGIFLASKKPSQ